MSSQIEDLPDEEDALSLLNGSICGSCAVGPGALNGSPKCFEYQRLVFWSQTEAMRTMMYWEGVVAEYTPVLCRCASY